jgi:hypothetical protein
MSWYEMRWRGLGLGAIVVGLLLFQTGTAVAAPQRVTVATMSVEGLPLFGDSRTSVDAGVQDQTGDGTHHCELLTPRPSSRVAGEPWSPLDLYMNVRSASEQQEDAATLGEPDIYFQGDDGNRNGQTDSASWTKEVPPFLLDSLDFFDPQRDDSAFTFVLGFTRGDLHFRGLFTARAEWQSNRCGVALYRCTQPSDANGSSCAQNGWTEQILQVIAVADKWGALRDQFRHINRDRERNDVFGLDIVVADGGSGRREKLVSK